MNNKPVDKTLLLLAVLMSGIYLPQATATNDIPSTDFLEYLGEFETKDGDWIDPVSMLQAQEQIPNQQASEVNTEDKPND